MLASSYTRLLRLLFPIVALLLVGCGTNAPQAIQPNTAQKLSSGAGSTPSSAAPINEVPTSAVKQQASDGNPSQVKLLDRPVALPIQLAYAPGAAGGSRSTRPCYDVTAPGTAQRLGDVQDKVDGPLLFVSLPQVDLGGSLTICYFKFTPGIVKEQIIAPDGTIIRTVKFSIDMPNHMDGNDFQFFPTDSAGTYTVVSETPDGESRANIEYTALPHPVNPEGQSNIGTVSRATDIFAPETSQVEYLRLSQFAPREAVNLYFFESCKSSASIGAGAWHWSTGFRFGAQIKVNDQGWAFVPLSESLYKNLNPALGYFVIARHEQPGRGYKDFTLRNMLQLEESLTDIAGFAIMEVAPTVSLPQC